MGRLDDKIALLTGGSRGQGAAEADLFAAEGATVYITDVLDDEGRATAERLGDAVTFMHFVAVNQTGTFLGIREAGRIMKPQRSGSIINISSINGLTGAGIAHAYSATKWAVRGMTKSAAQEFGRAGVRVNSVHPGVIDTDMTSTLARGDEVIGAIPWSESRGLARWRTSCCSWRPTKPRIAPGKSSSSMAV